MSETPRATLLVAETPDASSSSHRPETRMLQGISAAGIGLLASVLLLVTVKAVAPLSNYDTWFNLRIGHEFLSGWSIFHPEGTTQFATASWVPTQWGSEILAAQMDTWFGLPGVAWMFGVVYLAVVVANYVNCRREGAPLFAALVTGLVVISALYELSARGQAFSLVLLALTVGGWAGTVRDGRPRWWLVPLTWVWAMTHGLWSVGLVVGAVYFLGLFADSGWQRRAILRPAAVLGCCGLATLVTPLGPRLLISQLIVFHRSALSAEWGATTFRSVITVVVAAMIAVIVVCWARAGRRRSWTEVGLVLLAGGLTIYSVRLVPLGAIVLAPILTRALTETGLMSRARRTRGEVAVLVGSVAVCLVGLGLVVPHTSTEPGAVPSHFLARVRALPQGTVVLNQDILGGWLEYEAPNVEPVLDGMFDAYPVGYIEAYASALKVKPGWQSFVTKDNPRVAILTSYSSLGAALQDQLHWRVVQRDGPWEYLVRP